MPDVSATFMRNKQDEIGIMIRISNPNPGNKQDVIGITEIWGDDTHDCYIVLEVCNLFKRNNSFKKKGEAKRKIYLNRNSGVTAQKSCLKYSGRIKGD